jgi:hypothetical protein
MASSWWVPSALKIGRVTLGKLFIMASVDALVRGIVFVWLGL